MVIVFVSVEVTLSKFVYVAWTVILWFCTPLFMVTLPLLLILAYVPPAVILQVGYTVLSPYLADNMNDLPVYCDSPMIDNDAAISIFLES